MTLVLSQAHLSFQDLPVPQGHRGHQGLQDLQDHRGLQDPLVPQGDFEVLLDPSCYQEVVHLDQMEGMESRKWARTGALKNWDD